MVQKYYFISISQPFLAVISKSGYKHW